MNYDLLQAEKQNLKEETRQELYKFALDIIQESFYEEMMKNISIVECPDLFYNWYHKFTELRYPEYIEKDNQLYFLILTSATSGTLASKYFGKEFNVENFDGNFLIYASIHVEFQLGVDLHSNRTLEFEINKVSIKAAFKIINIENF